MKSIYDVMKASTVVTDENGNFYPDPLSFPLNRFKITNSVLEYSLEDTDLVRMDILMQRAYNTPEFDDILLMLNNLGIVDDLESGQTFYLPDRSDIESFLVTFNAG